MSSTPSYLTDANAVSPGRQVAFDMQGSSPPTGAYLGVDDSLWLMGSSSQNSVVLTVTYRLLMPDGSIVPNQQQVTVGGGRSPNWFQFNLPECFILGLSITANISAAFPVCYVTAIISRGNPVVGVISQVLCQGYCYQIAGISWPNGVNTTAFGAPGNIRSITGSTPAAGAEISESVPLNARWNLTSFTARFAASAAVGNRIVNLVIDDSVNVLQQILVTVTITASQTWLITWGQGLLNVNNPANSTINQALSNNLILNQFWRIRSVTTGIQAGDQWGLVQYCAEEWLAV